MLGCKSHCLYPRPYVYKYGGNKSSDASEDSSSSSKQKGDMMKKVIPMDVDNMYVRGNNKQPAREIGDGTNPSKEISINNATSKGIRSILNLKQYTNMYKSAGTVPTIPRISGGVLDEIMGLDETNYGINKTLIGGLKQRHMLDPIRSASATALAEASGQRVPLLIKYPSVTNAALSLAGGAVGFGSAVGLLSALSEDHKPKMSWGNMALVSGSVLLASFAARFLGNQLRRNQFYKIKENYIKNTRRRLTSMNNIKSKDPSKFSLISTYIEDPLETAAVDQVKQLGGEELNNTTDASRKELSGFNTILDIANTK